MAWIDGLDIPFAHYTDTGFFEFGSRRRHRRSAAARLSVRAAVGASRPPPLDRFGPASLIAHCGLPLGTHRCRTARTARPRRRRSRRRDRTWARRECGTPTRPPAVMSCRPSAPSSTGCGAGAAHQPRRDVGSRSSRSSTAPATSDSASDSHAVARRSHRRPVMDPMVDPCRHRVRPLRVLRRPDHGEAPPPPHPDIQMEPE